MKRLMLLSAGLVFGMMPAALVQTGSTVVDPATAYVRSQPSSTIGSFGTREVLKNGGFEKGTLPPWTSNAWMVDTINPHSGRYCAHDVGNYSVEQVFSPVPASIVQHVTLWARQPDQPAAQAYGFLYDDGSYEEFVHFPTPGWQQFDVTSRLNRSKNLRGFRVWGYSGGGPGPDSTYIDDVSITRLLDVSVTSITGLAPGETIPLNSQVVLGATVRNSGPIAESLYVWARIEQVTRLDNFADSIWLGLAPGQEQTVQFDTWIASPEGEYRFQLTVEQPDTVWHHFWVSSGSGIREDGTLDASRMTYGAIIVRGSLDLNPALLTAHCYLLSADGRSILDLHSGANDVSRLAPGVYFVHAAPGVRQSSVASRVVVTR